MEWTTDDWDPALRFWALPRFDPQLTEWLTVVDPSKPSIMAAREFAQQFELWGKDRTVTDAWVEPADLDWEKGKKGFALIQSEIGQLQQLMEDDRDRYLAEIEGQADGLAEYVIAFIGANQERHPWTIELINCALAIGNVAYMRWKSLYRRVRPSFLCPALAPPFGPPGHPSFPSGHSTLGHFIALLLLELPGLQQRFGIFKPASPHAGSAFTNGDLAGTGPVNSPLLWLAARLAKNRERLGVHYPSDSSGGRHFGQRLWHELVDAGNIDCPSLRKVIRHAQAEWPT